MNWVCIVLLAVFVIVLGVFLWMQFGHKRTFVRRVAPVPRVNRVAAPAGTCANGPNKAMVDSVLKTPIGNNDMELIASGDDDSKKSCPRGLYENYVSPDDEMPDTIEGHHISAEYLQSLHAQRPKVRMGLSRLAQLADPIRGDIDIEPGYVQVKSHYGRESIRDGFIERDC